MHEMAAPNGSNSEESLTKEEYLNPAVGVDNWSPSPSPIASPLHLKHYNTAPSLQAGVGIASGSSPAHVKHHSSFPQLNLGDAARKGLYSSSQVRTADEIEQDYVYVYSDEDIKYWVCTCVNPNPQALAIWPLLFESVYSVHFHQLCQMH